MQRPALKILPLLPEKARTLIDALDRYQNELYPPEVNRLDSIDALSAPNVIFLGILNEAQQDRVVGMGAAKVFAIYAEIKRLYIEPAYRGRGLARRLLVELETRMPVHISILRLETGIYQTAALQLYRSLGYRHCEAFGSHEPNPYSVFMEKRIER